MIRILTLGVFLFVINAASAGYASSVDNGIDVLQVRKFEAIDALRVAQHMTGANMSLDDMEMKDKGEIVKYYSPDIRIRYHRTTGYFDVVNTAEKELEQLFDSEDFPSENEMTRCAMEFVLDNGLVNDDLVEMEGRVNWTKAVIKNRQTGEFKHKVEKAVVVISRKLRGSGTPIDSYRNIEIHLKPDETIFKVRVYTRFVVGVEKVAYRDPRDVAAERDYLAPLLAGQNRISMSDVHLSRQEVVFWESKKYFDERYVFPFKYIFHEKNVRTSGRDGTRGFFVRVPVVDKDSL